MAFWITTHWPHREDQPIEDPHDGVWVQDKKRHLIERVAPGDLVFIYESQSGPTQIRTYAGGTTKHVRCHRGRAGIVGLVEVTEHAHEPENSQPEHYVNGSTLWWRYYAPTKSINSKGFIPMRRVNELLGYSLNNVFHGFGDEHSGLKEVPEELFNRILTTFNASSVQNEDKQVQNASHFRFGGGGEGPQHKALKEKIAADPAGCLNEPGLRLWQMEWSFPTGDRIDLVLKDRFERFVAVEVETCCDSSELAGPLQCMKYRAMLSYLFRCPIEEVRCFLVAHSIHADVSGRCTNHAIEVCVMPTV